MFGRRKSDTGFGEDAARQTLHLPRARLVRVVVADEMEQAVNGQKRQFRSEMPAGSVRLARGRLDGNDNIAQKQRVFLGERKERPSLYPIPGNPGSAAGFPRHL